MSKQFKDFMSKPIVKLSGVILLVGLALNTGYSIGKEVGIHSPATSKDYPASKVYITVGDEKITGKDISPRMEIYFYMNKFKEMTSEEIKTYEDTLFEYVSLTEALYQEALKSKLTVEDSVIEEDYKGIMDELSSVLEMEYEEIFKKFDINESIVKASLKKEALGNMYLTQSSEVTDEELKEEYNKKLSDFEQVKASHILISILDENNQEVSEGEKAKAKEKALEILEEVKRGGHFAQLAQENSDDKGTAVNGGDLDFFGKGTMVEEFENAVFSLKDNEFYPELVETEFGYHIIKRTGTKTATFEESREQLEEEYSYTKKNRLLDKLKLDYNITINN